jgi:ribonuclease E
MRSVALVGILLSTTILGGCAGTIGGITLSSISSFAGLASTLFTGADLGEHAASLITGKDCRFSEGLLREDRDVCEEPGSLATRDDFHGIFVERIDADGTVIYAAPKYMPASVGAGEYENKTDAIWAQIKTQKVAEENERQLARANAAQTIDVAALATGSVSSQSLAFLPAGVTAEAELADGETASQTASRPREISNAAPQAAKRAATPAVTAPAAEVKAPEAVEIPLDMSQPAIDEKSFAASVRSKESGEGGPFIATAASSTPVASTLINGEPVVVLRLRPIFSSSASSTAPVSSAMPIETTETASAEPATFVTPLSAQPSTIAPSPLAVLERTPTRSDAPVPGVAPETVAAAVEKPQLNTARPKVKPPAQELAAVETKPAKPVRAVPARARQQEDAADVYQPPASRTVEPAPSTLAADTMLYTPVQTPVDVPSEPAPAVAPALVPMTSEPTPAATGGPAPLAPMPQE